MKSTILTFLLSILLFLANGQEPKNWAVTAKIGDGFIVAHRPSVVHVLQKHTRSFEIDYTFKTHNKKDWEEIYNFPELGIGYQFFNLGNPTELGTAQGLFGLIKFNLWNTKSSTLTTHLGIGVGYVSKPFNTTNNYKNILIGSKINATITTGVEYSFRLSHQTFFNAGINLTHYSNGSSNVPNMGINLASINAGIQHFLNTPIKSNKEKFNLQRKSHIAFLLAGGVKQTYPPNSPKYAIGVFTSDYILPIKNKSIVAIGGDFYYDKSRQIELNENQIEYNNFNLGMRAGIHFGYGLQAGKCSGQIQTGYYLYNPFHFDGRIYSTLTIRYQINEHLFACFNLKSHFARADYFQYGIGYQF